MTPTDTTPRGGYAALDPCVHCGFCLPACPTYLATGDENDSPRGRIVLMRALESGELPPTDPAARRHLDACLGCRGCEPACPSGVGYGAALEAARADLARANGLSWTTRGLLTIFRHALLWRPLLTLLRWFRATGIPRRWVGWSRVGFGMGMVTRASHGGWAARRTTARRAGRPLRLALFEGCVTATLLRELNDATVAVLAACGHDIIRVPGQGCCGALHAHAGAREAARELAEKNLAAFDAVPADRIVVTSAGCGALLRDYHHLVEDPRASHLAAKVRDVTEILADSVLPPMRTLDLDVAYEPPCHLQHAQRVHDAPLAVLRAIPGVRVHLLPGAEQCCGGAGIYGLLHPELSQEILRRKLDAIRAAAPPVSLVATGNPGCLMQIGAGVQALGMPLAVVHPVELVHMALIGGPETREPRLDRPDD